jgi:hypothetical protein
MLFGKTYKCYFLMHAFYDNFIIEKNYERKIDWSVGNCQL